MTLSSMRLRLLLVAIPCVVLLFVLSNSDHRTTLSSPKPSTVALQPHHRKFPLKSQGPPRRRHHSSARRSGVAIVSNGTINDKKTGKVTNAVGNESSSGVSRLDRINRILKGYMEELSEMRMEALDRNSKDTSDWNMAAQPARTSGHLFSQLDFDRIHVRAPLEDVHYMYTENYYNYSSNKCDRFGITGRIHLPCNNNASSTIEVAMSSSDQFFLRQVSGNRGDSPVLTQVTVLRRGFINNEGDVLSSGYRIIPQRCIVKEHYDNDTDFFRHSDHGAGIPYHPEVFSAHMHKGTGVYHGIIEVMQRVVPYLGFLRRHRNIKVHFQFDNPIVQLLGIDQKRLVRTKEVKADVVYLPQGSGCWGTPVFPLQLLSLHMRRNLQSPKQDTIVLIKRNEQAKDRYFKNHDLIVEMLTNVAAKFGLQVSVFSDTPLPPLEEQVSMFSKALVIIGPHGAGLSNAIFSKPGTLILEAASLWGPSKTIKNHYLNMAEALGFRYYGLYSDDLRILTPGEIEKPLLDYLNAWKDTMNN